MEYAHLGRSGLVVSRVCLGSWLTYGAATHQTVAHECIDRAYSLGINFFDTANVYARGESERVVGKALSKYPRDSYVLATKVFFPMTDGPMPNNKGLSRKHIMEQCEASLKRLGTDYIDLYQCHRYDEETPLEETLRALEDLTRHGKVLHTGFSMWTAPQIEQAIRIQEVRGYDRFISSQPYYNLLGRDLEKAVLPLCERNGIGQIVFSPLAQGQLTGKYKPGAPPPADSRAADPKQNVFMNRGELDQALLEKVARLAPIAERLGITQAQLALAWCLRLDSVNSVIIGASRPGQVDENAAAAETKLDEETLREMEAAVAG